MVSKSKENQLIKACKRNDFKTVQVNFRGYLFDFCTTE